MSCLKIILWWTEEQSHAAIQSQERSFAGSARRCACAMAADVGNIAYWNNSGVPGVGTDFPGPAQDARETLPNLDRRVALLRQVDDPISRDSFNGGFNAFARQLDRTLPKDARIFLSGMLGKSNASQLGYYFILRNYLFPRTVAVSLDGKPVLQEGWFEGIPSDSPSELRANGFDLLLGFSTNNTLRVIPLTQKGVVPK